MTRLRGLLPWLLALLLGGALLLLGVRMAGALDRDAPYRPPAQVAALAVIVHGKGFQPSDTVVIGSRVLPRGCSPWTTVRVRVTPTPELLETLPNGDVRVDIGVGGVAARHPRLVGLPPTDQVVPARGRASGATVATTAERFDVVAQRNQALPGDFGSFRSKGLHVRARVPDWATQRWTLELTVDLAITQPRNDTQCWLTLPSLVGPDVARLSDGLLTDAEERDAQTPDPAVLITSEPLAGAQVLTPTQGELRLDGTRPQASGGFENGLEWRCEGAEDIDPIANAETWRQLRKALRSQANCAAVALLEEPNAAARERREQFFGGILVAFGSTLLFEAARDALLGRRRRRLDVAEDDPAPASDEAHPDATEPNPETVSDSHAAPVQDKAVHEREREASVPEERPDETPKSTTAEEQATGTNEPPTSP